MPVMGVLLMQANWIGRFQEFRFIARRIAKAHASVMLALARMHHGANTAAHVARLVATATRIIDVCRCTEIGATLTCPFVGILLKTNVFLSV